MFPRAPRFGSEKPDELPGPGQYDPKYPDTASYKRGAFLEKDARFKEKQNGPDGWVPAEPSLNPRSSKMVPSATSFKLKGKMPANAQVKLEDRLAKAEMRIEDLMREKVTVQNELTNAQTEHRLALQRENKMKASLEKSESGLKALKDKSSKLSSLQSKLDELMTVHEDSKKRRQSEIDSLRSELRTARLQASEEADRYEGLLDTARGRTEEAQGKVEELKMGLKSAERELREQRERLERAQMSKGREAEKEREEVERLRRELDEAQRALEESKKEMEQTNEAAGQASRRAENAHRERVDELEQQLRKAREASATASSETQSLKDRVRSAERETSRLQERLRDEQRRAEEERGSHESQLANVRAELEQGQRRVEEMEVALDEAERRADEAQEGIAERVDELESELRIARANMGIMTLAAGQLAASMIPQSRYDAVRAESVCARLDLLSSARQLRDREAQVGELALLVRQVQAERDELKVALREAEGDVRALIEDRRRAVEVEERDEGVDGSDDDEMDELERSVLGREQTVQLLVEKERNEALSSTVESLSAQLVALHAESLSVHASLQTSTSDSERLRSELDAARVEASSAQAALGEKEREVESLRRNLAERDWEAAKEETEKVNRELRNEKEANRRLAIALGNAKTAERTLREEIDQLEEGLSSAARYEEAYTQLSHQFSLLISRNALAEDEVSYLSSVNASLVGHTNPYQRIRHVDKIRRELGETKQSLLEACLERDEALQENGNLREELNSYRAIDVPLKDKPRAKLLRVSRAQGYGQGHGLGQSHAVGVPLRASRSVNTINSRSVGPARRAAGVGAPPKAVTAAGAARNVGLIPMAKVDGALEDAGERDQGWADENEMTLDELRAR